MSRHQQGWVLLEAPGKNLFPCLFQLLEAPCIRGLWPFPPAQGLHGFPGSLVRPSPDKTCCWERDPHSKPFGSGLSSLEPVGRRSPTWRRLWKASADAICCWFPMSASLTRWPGLVGCSSRPPASSVEPLAERGCRQGPPWV